MSAHVTLAHEPDGLATVVLDHAPVNALTRPVRAELRAVAAQVADSDARAVVLSGGPTILSAGADVAELADVAERADPHAARELADDLQETVRALATLPQVVVAAIEGHALGLGLELALAADLRVAGRNAQLALPQIGLGLLPGGGATQRLPALVGARRARELILGGAHHDAAEAHAMGLVDACCEPGEAGEAARERARAFAGGPAAQALAKEALVAATVDEDGLRRESALLAQALLTEDARRGLRAYRASGPGQASFHGR